MQRLFWIASASLLSWACCGCATQDRSFGVSDASFDAAAGGEGGDHAGGAGGDGAGGDGAGGDGAGGDGAGGDGAGGDGAGGDGAGGNGGGAGSCADCASACDGGECVECDDQCAADDQRCVEGRRSDCELGPDGCYVWSSPSDCATGQCDDGDVCFECENECQSGTSTCEQDELRSCQTDEQGCLRWSEPSTCPSGECMSSEACVECDDQCEAGDTICEGGEIRSCTADTLGCLDFGEPSPCSTGSCADTEHCSSCTHTCPSEDAIECTDGEFRRCEADAQGCLAWSENSACESGRCEDANHCFECVDECAADDVECLDDELRVCQQDDDGCFAFQATLCDGETPLCNHETARCECDSTSEPQCDDPATLRSCSDGVWSSNQCPSATPVCNPGTGCEPCTEHSQCPGSACHLSGPDQGQCFAASQVTDVTSEDDLTTGLSNLEATAQRVFRVSSGGTYSFTEALRILSGQEVALIAATNGVVFSGGPVGGDARNSFIYNEGGLLYVAGFTAQNSDPTCSGIGQSSTGVVWIDDMRVTGYYNAIRVAGEAHIRRSSVNGNTSQGISVAAGATLYMENSAIGPNIDSSVNQQGMYIANSTVIDLRYVTIVGNAVSIACAPPVPLITGTVRNSLLLAVAGGSISVCNDQSFPQPHTISFSNNAIDTAFYSSSWFADPADGNFRLSATGRTAVPQVAERSSADPLYDIDGDVRPTGAAYPGIDEP